MKNSDGFTHVYCVCTVWECVQCMNVRDTGHNKHVDALDRYSGICPEFQMQDCFFYQIPRAALMLVPHQQPTLSNVKPKQRPGSGSWKQDLAQYRAGARSRPSAAPHVDLQPRFPCPRAVARAPGPRALLQLPPDPPHVYQYHFGTERGHARTRTRTTASPGQRIAADTSGGLQRMCSYG